MRLIISVFLILLLQSCNNKKAFRNIKDNADSLNYKKTNYISLNDFVKYHIIKNGRLTNDTNLSYEIKPIAVYYYYNHQYNTGSSKEVNLNSDGLKSLILSDTFNKRDGFSCIFRINSNINYKWKPYLLERITITPKKKSTNDALELMEKLRKKNFVNDIFLDTFRNVLDTVLGGSRNYYITIKLNPEYWGLKKERDLCAGLNKWPDIYQATYVNMFTGRAEYDMVFNVTSHIQERK